jgi:AmiR/NasT family two-component response regulator
MRKLLRRLWRELTYDPLVEFQRAKALLAKRLEWSEEKAHELRKSKLKLWRTDRVTEKK